MPIYEYQCQKCGHHMEELQHITEEPLTKCPSCGENELKRLIGAGSGLIFKGSGFYLTDYKKSDKKSTDSNTTKSNKPPDTKTESTKSKTTDSKKKE